MIRRRVLAGAADVAVVAGWVVVVLGAAWALSVFAGPGPQAAALSGLWEGLVAAAVILPVSLVGAWADCSFGTPGKRWQELRVQKAAGGRAGFGRCLARNVLEYGLPLAFAQTVALIAVSAPGRWPVQAWVLAGLTVVLVAVYVVGAVTGDQTTLCDLVTGTRVREHIGRRVAVDETGVEPEPEPQIESGPRSYKPRRAL